MVFIFDPKKNPNNNFSFDVIRILQIYQVFEIWKGHLNFVYKE